MKFTKVKKTTPQELQLNAGIILKEFNPESPIVDSSAIFAATSGGVSFSDKIEFVDMFEDIDNMPKNTMEGKQIDSREVTLSGTFLTITPAIAKSLMAAGDISTSDTTHIIPRDTLTKEDFDDFWWVGDYSDKNGNTNGGYCAVHIMNALSTDGLNIQSGDKAKGQFSVVYTAHYSIENIETVPYELYIKAGTAEA